MEDIIGRKIKLTGECYSHILEEHKICTVMGLTERRQTFRALSTNGQTYNPYTPEQTKFTPECEYIEPELYTVEALKGKDVAIHCKTQEEWDEVTEILGYKWKIHSKWEDYGDRTCISTKDTQYCRLTYYDRANYQIIPAELFIKHNTKQPTMDKQAIQEQIQTLKDQLQKLEDSMKEPVWEPKIGDWVITMGTGKDRDNCSDLPQGSIYQIVEIADNWYRRKKDQAIGIKKSGLRPATPAEIKAAEQKKEVTLPIGNGTHKVVVKKGSIVGPDGKLVAIEDIDRLCSIMKGTQGFCGWSITFSEVKVGCCESIEYNQLKAIQEAYNKL